MAIVPEFISVLRKIRDVIYPSVNELYEDSLVLKESIDVGKAEFDADFAQFNTDYNTFNTQKDIVIDAVADAEASALSASQSATIATNKSNEIKGITAQSTTGAPGTSAAASYNPTDGKFTFVIPQGVKGDKGESFTVNSSGPTASRTLYDNQPTGWSFLDITTSLLYFKQSNATADWSSGIPFGKGDTGADGEPGVGIESFAFVSTTDSSGLAGQSGATDTYRVTLTNTNTFDYVVYNGLDADDSLVLHKALDEDVTGAKTFADNTLKVKASDDKVATIRLENGAISNVDLTIPKDGGILAVINSPTFTGTPNAPTATAQTNNTQIATTAYVDGKMVRGTTVASTSGTIIDFIGIPSWVKKITVMANQISTNGTSMYQIQLGAGSILTSGYRIYASKLGLDSISSAPYTSGFVVRVSRISESASGHFTFCKLSDNVWTGDYFVSDNTNGESFIGGGSVTLSGVLDRVRITTVNGTDIFDAGSINIMYEG